MTKFDRVISTLILLQTKKVIKASAIAERYDISLRTVYRDIKTLKNAGIPIIGDPGIGYSVMDGYRMPPIMFNEGETSALLTAEKFIGKLTEQDTQAHYSSALMKIKAILRSGDKQSLAVLDDAIEISTDNNLDNKTYLQDIFRSIAAKLVLHIQYRKADGTNSNRNLEAIGCYHKGNHWYLIAYCQLQSDYRTFKMNRIVKLQVLDNHFDTQHISLKRYIDSQNKAWKDNQQFKKIEIAFNHSLVEFAESRKYYFGFVEQVMETDVVRMTFLNPSIEVLARWLLQFGDQATVIAPPELRHRVKTLATQLYNHYQ